MEDQRDEGKNAITGWNWRIAVNIAKLPDLLGAKSAHGTSNTDKALTRTDGELPSYPPPAPVSPSLVVEREKPRVDPLARGAFRFCGRAPPSGASADPR
jgi:hypothetical protein